MGRIKTTPVKRMSKSLMKDNKESFKPNFEENKKVVAELLKSISKPIRNKIAGYITRLARQSEEGEKPRAPPKPTRPSPQRRERR